MNFLIIAIILSFFHEQLTASHIFNMQEQDDYIFVDIENNKNACNTSITSNTTTSDKISTILENMTYCSSDGSYNTHTTNSSIPSSKNITQNNSSTSLRSEDSDYSDNEVDFLHQHKNLTTTEILQNLDKDIMLPLYLFTSSQDQKEKESKFLDTLNSLTTSQLIKTAEKICNPDV